jgi:hypothetical protein
MNNQKFVADSPFGLGRAEVVGRNIFYIAEVAFFGEQFNTAKRSEQHQYAFLDRVNYQLL